MLHNSKKKLKKVLTKQKAYAIIYNVVGNGRNN